jgi:hypothetical protein
LQVILRVGGGGAKRTSFHPYGRPVYAAGMAADDWMTLLVELHTPVWSPASRHDCAIASPHVQGFATPHSHLEGGRAGRGEDVGKGPRICAHVAHVARVALGTHIENAIGRPVALSALDMLV